MATVTSAARASGYDNMLYSISDGSTILSDGYNTAAQSAKARILIILALSLLVMVPKFASAANVPYISCSQEDLSQQRASTGRLVTVNLPDIVAEKLAFFAGDFISVLAPRGWKCTENLGGNYSSITVYPSLANNDSGPVVEASVISSDSQDGGWDTTEYMCRYFSKTKYNAWNSCKNGQWYPPQSKTPATFLNQIPVYPADKLVNINDYMIQYETPPNSGGLGNSTLYDPTLDSQTLKDRGLSDLETDGFLIIGGFSNGKHIYADGSMELFKARLPEGEDVLKDKILTFARNCYLGETKAICRRK